jgi:hypothetical protein
LIPYSAHGKNDLRLNLEKQAAGFVLAAGTEIRRVVADAFSLMFT